MRGLFITGTGTGVGKTFIAAGIVRWLRRKGLDAVPMKPVQTGCPRAAGGPSKVNPSGLRATDLESVLNASHLTPPPVEMNLMCPYRYNFACSPHAAGRAMAHYPHLGAIERCARRLAAAHEAIIVEGAGGVLVPLDDDRRTMRDLIVRLGLPVVVVAQPLLGTINHTLLTLEALRSVGATPVGVVFSEIAEVEPGDDWIAHENCRTIEELGGIPFLGSVLCLPDLAGDKVDVRHPAWKTFDQCLKGLPMLLKLLREQT